MKNMYLILSVLFLFTGCGEEEAKQQEKNCNDVIINSEQYNNSQTDSFELIKLIVENECLKISVRYGGGCEEVFAKLIDSEDLFESNPVQRNLRIVFTDNDECEALVEKDFHFNISNLRVENESEIKLNFEGSDLSYIYQY